MQILPVQRLRQGTEHCKMTTANGKHLNILQKLQPPVNKDYKIIINIHIWYFPFYVRKHTEK